jgi:hypothetical protein
LFGNNQEETGNYELVLYYFKVGLLSDVAATLKTSLQHFFYTLRLRKTALKRLFCVTASELVAERVETECCLRKMTFVSPCPQGQNRCESTGSAFAGS